MGSAICSLSSVMALFLGGGGVSWHFRSQQNCGIPQSKTGGINKKARRHLLKLSSVREGRENPSILILCKLVQFWPVDQTELHNP